MILQTGTVFSKFFGNYPNKNRFVECGAHIKGCRFCLKRLQKIIRNRFCEDYTQKGEDWEPVGFWVLVGRGRYVPAPVNYEFEVLSNNVTGG